MLRRTAPLAIAAGLLASACATTPACREVSEGERQLFALFVAGDNHQIANSLANRSAPLAEELRDMPPELRNQIFGQRMGDRSVRSVMMQPPLCAYDQEVSRQERITYIFPEGRFASQHPEGQTEFNPGRPAIDHIACRFIEEDGQWKLADACLQTFRSTAVAGT
ncbi:hypothetical protein FKB34_00970 [Glycocaulis profundi]|nr:hypothetical protein FKB34_00970 [Glycocaulis profundi]